MFLNMGLLTSYNRSFSYFRESVGLHNNDAQLGTAMVSAFFGVACSSSFTHLASVRDAIPKNGCKRFPYLGFLYIVSQILRPGGGFKFYSEMLQNFVLQNPGVVPVRWNFETIREFEESKGF